VWSYALLSLHRHRSILVVSLTALVVMGVACSLLASADGARGAAIATAISEVVFLGLLIGATYRAGLRPWITWGNIPRSLLGAGLGAATLLIGGLPSVARLVIGLAVYGLVLVVLRAIPEEILELLPGRRAAAG
jgi:O-antigen/teichoic acid export membrane protein